MIETRIMLRTGLETDIADAAILDRAATHFRAAGIALPTFEQLADPATIPAGVTQALDGVDPDAADPLNLYRVHWHMAADRSSTVAVPGAIELPSDLTGVDARIVVALGDRFPMITAHKVLAAYGCLAPAVITGRFDPTEHRALWPSTGNYCRGGVAISRIMGCHGVAILPEGMSRERFEWLDRWVVEPGDIVRTPGSESNVKEIYDKCAELAADPQNVVFNQFSEFGNHLVHYACTGAAMSRVFEGLRSADAALELAGFVSATGSAGTLAAGDYLKERHGARVIAVEAAECPTLLDNGFGEHNIQGIGDKHVPLIHNVMNTDVVVAISDRATDALAVMFASEAGRGYLQQRHGLSAELVAALPHLGLSGLCNVLAAIATARHFDLGPRQVLLTVATDGVDLYRSEVERVMRRDFTAGFDELAAAEVFGEHLRGRGARLRELGHAERTRIFNLGYFTWVEQQGLSLADFERRRSQRFWRGMRGLLPQWDERIREFNARTGLA